MSAAIGNSNVSSQTSGKFVDVRDYGAVADGSTDNRPMFQAALDALGASGGGTLYIPGNTIQTAYYLASPVFMNWSNCKIKGSGKESTFITTLGPAFVVGLEPKNWNISRSSYVDSDTLTTVNTKDAAGKFILTDGRYRTDVWQFTSAAESIYKSGPSGVPPLEFAVSPGLIYGFRGRGVCKGTFMGHPMATGCTKGGFHGMLGWEEQPVATFNVIYYAHDGKISGGLFGCGDTQKPDPWLLTGDGTNFNFWLAATNDGLVEKSSVVAIFPQPETLGLHRVSVQVDFINKRITAWVDRVQVAVTLQNIVVSGFNHVSIGTLFNEYNRFARWETSDFTVGSEQRTVSQLRESGSTSDFTIVGCSVFTELMFNHSTVGSAQSRIDAAPVTDSNTVMPTGGETGVANRALGCLAIRTETGHNLATYTRGTNVSYGMLAPEGGPNTIVNPAISDLTIIGNSNSAAGDGITLGTYLQGQIHDVSIRNGFYNSIGSFDFYISYAMYIRDCELYSPGASLHLMNMIVHANNIKFGYIGRCCVRTSGSQFFLRGGATNDMAEYGEGFLIAFAGKSIAAGYRIEDLLTNFEGTRTSPRIAHFYVEKGLYHYNNRLIIKNVVCDASPPVPTVYLNDVYATDFEFYQGDVSVEDTGLPSVGQAVKVRGKDWKGIVEVKRMGAMDEIVQISATSPHQYSHVRTVHKDFWSVPNIGGWIKDCHDVYPPALREGGVIRWAVKTSGREGSQNPPVWTPIEIYPSRNKNALSGNVLSSMHVRIAANHPNIASPVSLWATLTLEKKAAEVLSRVLIGSGTLDRNNVQFKYSRAIPFIISEFPDTPISSSSIIANNTNFWNDASGGQKTNKVAVTMTSENPADVPSIVKTRAGFAVLLGNTTPLTFILGKTQMVGKEFFNNATFTIPIDGILIANSVRDGSWTTYMQNKILNWIFGSPTEAFPTTFHFGLSSTAIAVDGTGITEPSGGSYARVSVSPNSTNFGIFDEFKSTWANKTTITFPTPTGDWGNCEWGFVSDAATGGNIVAKWPLNRPCTIKSGDAAPAYYAGTVHFQV